MSDDRSDAEVQMFKAAMPGWLADGLEVFEELRVIRLFEDGSRMDRSPRTLDALQRRDAVLTAVEGKCTIGSAGLYVGLTMQLYQQTKRWQRFANRLVMLSRAPQGMYAVNRPESEHHNVLKLARLDGIGVTLFDGKKFERVLKPQINVAAQTTCLLKAIETHRNILPAGSAAGHRSRPGDRKYDPVVTALRADLDSDAAGMGCGCMTEKQLKIELNLTDEEGRAMMKAAERKHIHGVGVKTIAGVRHLYLINQEVT